MVLLDDFSTVYYSVAVGEKEAVVAEVFRNAVGKVICWTFYVSSPKSPRGLGKQAHETAMANGPAKSQVTAVTLSLWGDIFYISSSPVIPRSFSSKVEYDTCSSPIPDFS